jgi:hypothetical protein
VTRPMPGARVRPGSVVLALVAVASLFVLNGCVLVGDSVSSFMVPDLQKVVPIVDADFGRSLDQHGWQTQESGAQAVHRWASLHVPWIIIQVGANDVIASADPEVWRASIQETLAGVPSQTCVAWVLVYDGRQPQRSDLFNDVVAEELTSSHLKHVLVPWPDAVRKGGMLLDSVHLTPLGRATLTRLVGNAVASFTRMGCG